MLTQALADRLVVASEEQDVLYVLHWLQEMKQENCLEEAINHKHSWKNSSALEITINAPFSTLRKIVLEILLLHGGDTRMSELLDLAMEKRHAEVLAILLNWNRGREEASDARRLSEMSLEDAANYIDSNLPPPPNAASLTGFNDPPPRPSHLPSPPVEPRNSSVFESSTLDLPESSSKPLLLSPQQPPTAPAKMRSSLTRKDSSKDPPPSNQPSPSRRTISETSLSNWTRRSQISETSPRSLRPENPTIRLNFSWIPVNFEQNRFEALFKEIDVPNRTILYRVSHPPTYAFVDVGADDAAYTIKALHGTTLGRRQLRCMVATSRNPEAPRPVRLLASPRRTLPPSIVSQSIKHVSQPPSPVKRTVSPPRPNASSRHSPRVADRRSSHSATTSFDSNCVLFNLPLEALNGRGPAAHLLEGDEIVKFPEHDQSVLIPATRSSSAVDRLARLWDGYMLEGRRLKVVRVKEGMGPKETIEDYFRSGSIPSYSASRSHQSPPGPQRSRSRSRSPRRQRNSISRI